MQGVKKYGKFYMGHVSSNTSREHLIVDCMALEAPPNPLDVIKFWVFVELGQYDVASRYWIVPDWWMRNDIYHAHQSYLGRHGGRRAKNPDSKHHSIEEKRLSEWQDKWAILGIFSP